MPVGDIFNSGKWTVISSRDVFSHHRLELIEDIISLPDGSKFDYLKWKDDGGSGVTIIARNKEGKILLQKEYSYVPNKKLFQFPGGGVPKGELIEEGANRELMEEANLYANTLKLLNSYYPMHRHTSHEQYVYLATDLEEKSLPSDVMEEFESFWFSEEEIDEMIKNGEMENGYVLSAWSLYKMNKDA